MSLRMAKRRAIAVRLRSPPDKRESFCNFLPGGWEPLKHPDPPYESWKAPLYQLVRDRVGALRRPLGALLPPAPLHELFEAAWARVCSGDAPAYEEVR